jgi:hypothetical protein
MLIEVRTDANINGSEQSSAEVKAVVHAAIHRYRDRIKRVDVHLSDTVGHKTGHDDKCCMIEARRDVREPIVVTHQESTMEQAIQGAIHNLKKAVESALGKETTRDHLRDHH